MGNQQAARPLVRLPYGLVAVILAPVLIAPAGLKFTTEPLPPPGVFSSRSVWLGIVQVELVFGVWMLFGIAPRPTRVAAVILFSLLACVSLGQLLLGGSTCHCFGAASVWPGWMLMGDVGAVACLMLARPPRTARLASKWRVLGFVALWMPLAAAVFHPLASQRHPRLSVVPDSLDFGEAWSQDRFEWTLPLRNESAQSLTIMKIIPSCTCAGVEAAPIPMTIASGEVGTLRATLNLADVATATDPRSERDVSVEFDVVVNGEGSVHLALHGKVLRAYHLDAAAFNFGRSVVLGWA